MGSRSGPPRILIVTPEVTYLPRRMDSMSRYLTAKAGGLADVSAALIKALFEHGADVHVAIPNYRAIFRHRLAPFLAKEHRMIRAVMPDDRVHLAEDRAFFYLNRVYADSSADNVNHALAFQREVINNIIPRVAPDLIHCNDWMTGLIPGVARQMGVPSLFTVHNIHTVHACLSQIEDRGIDAQSFWNSLYYKEFATDYASTRGTNPVDFLVSGVFAAHFVNTVSPTFLKEMIDGQHAFVPEPLRRELTNKHDAGCAVGILNSPDPSFCPSTDNRLHAPYGPDDALPAKQENKQTLQANFGLKQDENAPLFFWPSRLDPIQKGCELLAEICSRVVSSYRDQNLQVVFVADGPFQDVFRRIVEIHRLRERVAICDFDQKLEHRAFAASDFVLMPSRFEPCGLPQMIGAIYGSLPVAHDTGGLHDTITHLNVEQDSGNGFLFENYDSNGLLWAIHQAMAFYNLPAPTKARQVSRIMSDAASRFNHSVTARQYLDLYERMLQRPVVNEWAAVESRVAPESQI